MNDFIAGKLGEVLAFSRVGTDTIGKGEAALLKMLDKGRLSEMQSILAGLAQKIETIAKKEGVMGKAEKEAEETEKKVTKMRDTYLGGEWDDESEMLEWMGFYAGACLVHWHLVAGAAKELKHEGLAATSREALYFYETFFAADEDTLQTLGAKAAH